MMATMPEEADSMKVIYLKYGDGKEILLNANCASCNFLIYLRERLEESGCKFGPDSKSDDLDLCDTNGTIQGVQKLLPMEQVGQLVNNKEIYVPIIVNTASNEEDEVTSFTPILSSGDQLYDKILKILNKQQKKTSKKKNSIFVPDATPPPQPPPPSTGKGSTSREDKVEKKQKKDSKGVNRIKSVSGKNRAK